MSCQPRCTRDWLYRQSRWATHSGPKGPASRWATIRYLSCLEWVTRRSPRAACDVVDGHKSFRTGGGSDLENHNSDFDRYTSRAHVGGAADEGRPLERCREEEATSPETCASWALLGAPLIRSRHSRFT